MLAHEIGNPLNVMAIHTELLRRSLEMRGALDESSAETIALLQAELGRLRQILSDYRSAVRSSEAPGGTMPLRRLVHDVLALHTPMASEVGIVLRNEVADNCRVAARDVGRIKQILLNLTKNAIEAMPDGGTLTVCAKASDVALELDIIDTGKGMDPERTVLDPPPSSKPDGMGLGMSIVRQLVGDLGGEAAFESSPHGTRFRIRLPTAKMADPRG